jgi:hypothetical protein
MQFLKFLKDQTIFFLQFQQIPTISTVPAAKKASKFFPYFSETKKNPNTTHQKGIKKAQRKLFILKKIPFQQLTDQKKIKSKEKARFYLKKFASGAADLSGLFIAPTICIKCFKSLFFIDKTIIYYKCHK